VSRRSDLSVVRDTFVRLIDRIDRSIDRYIYIHVRIATRRAYERCTVLCTCIHVYIGRSGSLTRSPSDRHRHSGCMHCTCARRGKDRVGLRSHTSSVHVDVWSSWGCNRTGRQRAYVGRQRAYVYMVHICGPSLED